MCSPLHIRAPIKVAVIKRPPSLICLTACRRLAYSVAAILVANLVGVDGRAGAAGDCANDRALLAAD